VVGIDRSGWVVSLVLDVQGREGMQMTGTP
jgi:hypothetical protein